MKKLLFAVVFASGCSGGGGVNSGTIEGRVTNDASFAPVSGAVVTAFEVEANGSLTAVSDSVTTGVDGSYRLEVTFGSSSISDLVVEATSSGSFEGRAIISSEIRDGSVVSAPPITGETTVEADVYVEARSSFDSHTTTEGLRAMIDSQTSAAIETSNRYQQDVRDLAFSVVTGLRARGRMLVHSSVGITESTLQAFLEAEADAQADLDSALHLATTQSQVDAAISAYVSAMANARSSIDPSHWSQSVQAQVTAAISTSLSLSSNVSSELRVHLERMKAEAVAGANQAAFTALGASGSLMGELQYARMQIDAALEASGGVQSSIDSAWFTYETFIRSELKMQVESMHSGGSYAIDTVQSTLLTSLSSLQSAITEAGGNVEALISAYGSFTAVLDASVRGNGTLGELSSAQLDATISVLATLNL